MNTATNHSSATAAHAVIAPKCLTPENAAIYLGKTAAWLKRARMGKAEGPQFIRAGRRVHYLISDLDAWLAAQRRGATNAAHFAAGK